MTNQPDRLETGLEQNRLALGGSDLHAGEPLELLIGGAWTPGRVEWSPTLGWYALLRQARHDHREVAVLLRPGLLARQMRDRSEGR